MAVPVFHSIFFPLYEWVKEWALDRQYSLFQSCLISTFAAGTVCNTLTNPIWVVRTRLMAQYLHHESKHYRSNSPLAVIR